MTVPFCRGFRQRPSLCSRYGGATNGTLGFLGLAGLFWPRDWCGDIGRGDRAGHKPQQSSQPFQRHSATLSRGFIPLVLVALASIIFIARRSHIIGRSSDNSPRETYIGSPLGFSRNLTILRAKKDPSKVDMIVFHGKNVSGKEVDHLEDAYFVSRLTGTKVPLQLSGTGADGPTLMYPSEINALPPAVDVRMSAFLNPFEGISESAFLAKFESVDLVVKYQNGEQDRIPFDKSAVRAALAFNFPRVFARATD